MTPRIQENTLLLLVYYKGYNSGTAKWKTFIGHSMEKKHRPFMLFLGVAWSQFSNVFSQPISSPNPT